jgi:tetratricopeptide (TPR) repeat protein
MPSVLSKSAITGLVTPTFSLQTFARAFAGALFLAIVAGSGSSFAEIVIVKTPQSDLVRRSSVEQGALLANIVHAASWKCGQAQASLEKTYKEGSGGWLVQCAEGQDYWVLVPSETGNAATTLPCILARTMSGTNCYANFRTASRDQIAQCTSSPFPDRMIGGCSAVIQSGRLDGRPDALAVAYDARGIGYIGYRQFDLARADFDKALSLNSKDTDGLYNRAVTYERTKDYEKALDDLNVLLRLKPDHVYGQYERGFVYLAKRNYDQAIKDFDETIRLDPGHVTAYRKRGDAYQAKGDTARAQNDFARARELETKAK